MDSEETMNTKEVQDQLQIGNSDGNTFLDLPNPSSRRLNIVSATI